MTAKPFPRPLSLSMARRMSSSLTGSALDPRRRCNRGKIDPNDYDDWYNFLVRPIKNIRLTQATPLTICISVTRQHIIQSRTFTACQVRPWSSRPILLSHHNMGMHAASMVRDTHGCLRLTFSRRVTHESSVIYDFTIYVLKANFMRSHECSPSHIGATRQEA